MLTEVRRMQKLAGLLKEDEGSQSLGQFDIDESYMKYFDFDINELIEKIGLDEYQEGVDYELAIARGDDFPHAILIQNPKIMQDQHMVDLLSSLEDPADEEEDFEADRYDWDGGYDSDK